MFLKPGLDHLFTMLVKIYKDYTSRDLRYVYEVTGWFFLFLAYSGSCMWPAAKKLKQKKHTEHERVQFWGTTEHERGALHARHTAKTHTEHERVQF